MKFLVAVLFLSGGCSMDFIAVAPEHVKMVKYAEQPILRGPTAPGAFRHAWTFIESKGYLFDPSELEILSGGARSKLAKTVVVVTNQAAPYAALDSFQEVAAPEHHGLFKYQLSKNSSAWFFHNGKKWVAAGPNSSQANTADEISKAIGTFHMEIGLGSLAVKVFLISKSAKDRAKLKEFSVQGILPSLDSPE